MSLKTIIINGKKRTCTDYVIRTLSGTNRKLKNELFKRWPDLRTWTPNDRTERRGRLSASELPTDVARPRSLQ